MKKIKNLTLHKALMGSAKAHVKRKEQVKKVLVVEDDKDFLWLLREGFDNQGLLMMYAKDGESGFAMAEKEHPDLMVIDILLPKMDGIAMAKKLKEKGIRPQIIFLTNLKDPEHISQAIDVVVEADYIIKADVHMGDIVARVKNKLHVI